MAEPISKASRKVVQRIVLVILALLVLALPGDTPIEDRARSLNSSAKAAERDSRSR